MRRSVLFAFSLLLFASFAESDGDALVKLLNSRSAQSPKTYAAAAQQVRQAADAGGMLQQYVIALISEDANAPAAAKLSPKQRREWIDNTRERIRQLAEQRDNALAWYLLSLEKNDLKSLERAAEGGNVQAQNAWGTILINEGLAMPATNSTKAVALLEKGFACFKAAAAKTNANGAVEKDANGLYNMGMCYMQGYGCKLDAVRAFECFRTAAEEGHPEAINNIGGFYRDGILVMTNAEMSVRWFRKSAELGNPYGQLNYALALQRGDGVKKDEKAAAELMKAAAEQNCAEAMTAYGMCFYAGRGVKQDSEQAFRWFRRGAEAGFPPAMDNLASCYERGMGTPKDVLKSALWKMRFRAANGDPDARAWVLRQEKESAAAGEGKE